MSPAEHVRQREPELSLSKVLLLMALSSASEEHPALREELAQALDMPRLERALDAYLRSSGLENDAEASRRAILEHACRVLHDFERQPG
jgi:hypothetical protein